MLECKKQNENKVVEKKNKNKNCPSLIKKHN